MKRNLSILIMVLLVLATVAGSTIAKETIVVVTPSNGAPGAERVKRIFESKFDATIEIVTQAYNLTHEKIVTAAASGSAGYDVIPADTVYIPSYVEAGFLTPLDSYIPKDYLNDITAGSLKEMTYKGKIYALGGGTANKYLFYNTQILRKAGFNAPPKTWEELINMSQVIQRKGLAKYGIAWGWSQGEGLMCDYNIFLRLFKGDYKLGDKWVVNTKEAVEALQFMADTIYKYKIADPASTSLDDREVLNSFLKGDIPFVLGWPFGWVWAKDPTKSRVVDSVEIALVPGLKKTGVVSASTSGASGLAILSSSKNKALAWEYIRIATSPEVQKYNMQLEHNQNISLKSVYDDPELLAKFPELKVMRKQTEYSFPRPRVAWYPQFSETLRVEIHKALTGIAKPKQALDEAQKKIDVLARQFDRHR
ncbi:MAG TPA: extracellular solute-binding protein [Firmicutes bacterium]|nr:extracellular solute-binding protein [Bacillota bacterium]